MATGNATVTTSANFIPELWSAPVLDYAEKRFALRQRVRDVSELLPADLQRGDTIHVPRVAAETARTKAEDTAVTFDTFTDGKTDLSIDQHVYVAKRIEDITSVQANIDLLEMYSESMGYAVADNIEGYIAATVLQGATGNDTAVATDNQMTAAEFRSGETKLLNSNWDIDGAKATGNIYLYGNPAIVQHLKGLGTFTDTDKTGLNPSGTIQGMQLFAYGIPLIPSTDWGSAGTTGEEPATMWMKEGVLFAMQQDLRFQAHIDLNHLSTSVVIDALYGSVLTYPAAGTLGPVVNFTNP